MKGLVFTEFLEWVEACHSPEVADRIINAAQLPNDGAYTAVGQYDHAELVRLLEALAADTSVPAPALTRALGKHLAERAAKAFPALFEARATPLAFLSNIEAQLQVEVRKLYPDAELPSLTLLSDQGGTLELQYRCPWQMVDLGLGLIEGVGRHYGVPLALQVLAHSDEGVHLRVYNAGASNQAAAKVQHASIAV